MIDLHIHTIYSDGTESCKTILEKCQEKELQYISITDHNTALAYNELEKLNTSSLFKGNIIPGIELNTKVLDIPIEILGYGIDYEKMNNLVEKVYLSPTERNKIEVSRLYKKCIENNIYLDKNCLERYTPDMFASVFFHNEITKNDKNKAIISPEAWNSSKDFYRQYMSDPQNKLYVEMDDLVPDFETAGNLIRNANGLIFIPHIFEYKKNSKIILKHILKNYTIDGIECYYTTFSKEQTKELITLCTNKKLFISGGSDFHGKNKPDVNIGTGNGSLKIPEHILNNWKNSINFF